MLKKPEQQCDLIPWLQKCNETFSGFAVTYKSKLKRRDKMEGEGSRGVEREAPDKWWAEEGSGEPAEARRDGLYTRAL